MTIEWNCNHGDYSSSSYKINYFTVTTTQGIPVDALKEFELAEFQSLWEHHLHTHPGHSPKVSFSVPEGYEIRDRVIYKASS